MGREVRRVPPNWQHPKKESFSYRTGRVEENYQPMKDNDYDSAMKEWLDELAAWLAGGLERCMAEHPNLEYSKDAPYSAFALWHSEPPNKAYYRPAWKEECTWFQVYETVSEGTPVTPAFATQEELIDYLVENGDFWDQKRRREGTSSMPCAPWKRENAEKFVKRKWAPSLMVNTATGEIKEPRDGI